MPFVPFWFTYVARIPARLLLYDLFQSLIRLDIGFQADKQQAQVIVMQKLKNNSRPIIGNSKEFSNKVHPGPDFCLVKPNDNGEGLVQDTELGASTPLSSPSCIVEQPLSHDSVGLPPGGQQRTTTTTAAVGSGATPAMENNLTTPLTAGTGLTSVRFSGEPPNLDQHENNPQFAGKLLILQKAHKLSHSPRHSLPFLLQILACLPSS